MPGIFGKESSGRSSANGHSFSSYPNITTVAEFRPNSLNLYFHRISKEVIASLSPHSNFADTSQLGVIAHELTHWSDQISTVWGQDYIVKLFKAYAAAASGRESEFCRVVDLFDEERRILLPLYYHVVEKNVQPHNVTKPWRISFSSGQEFDAYGKIDPNNPLFFVRFGDNLSGDSIARQPITVGSLLETTAMWSELSLGLDLLNALSEDERLVASKLWSNGGLQMLYDPELTVYTAPVHLLAFYVRTSDVLEAYERAAVLASIALNLTGSLFEVLRLPADWDAFSERHSKFIRARNRGYVFAVLARNATSVLREQPMMSWVSEILRKSGLPAYKVISQEACIYLDKIAQVSTAQSSMDSVRDYLLEVGRVRARAKNAKAFTGKVFDALGGYELATPPMFDCNGTIFHVGKTHLDPARFDSEAMDNAAWNLSNFTDNFLQGARGFRA